MKLPALLVAGLVTFLVSTRLIVAGGDFWSSLFAISLILGWIVVGCMILSDDAFHAEQASAPDVIEL